MKVKVLPTEIEFEATVDKSLLQMCLDHGVHINSFCKGQPRCAECRIRIVQGGHNVMAPNNAELGVIGSNHYLDGRRLACQVRVYGDITIDVTEQSLRDQSIHKKVRGFRSKDRGYQSQAVLDTIVLKKEKKGGENG